MMNYTHLHARFHVQVLVACKSSKQCLLAVKTRTVRILPSRSREATRRTIRPRLRTAIFTNAIRQTIDVQRIWTLLPA
jgi:hypothetical protein